MHVCIYVLVCVPLRVRPHTHMSIDIFVYYIQSYVRARMCVSKEVKPRPDGYVYHSGRWVAVFSKAFHTRFTVRNFPSQDIKRIGFIVRIIYLRRRITSRFEIKKYEARTFNLRNLTNKTSNEYIWCHHKGSICCCNFTNYKILILSIAWSNCVLYSTDCFCFNPQLEIYQSEYVLYYITIYLLFMVHAHRCKIILL